MADAGNMDINKAMPMMQNMAKMAARADYGSKFLAFTKKMAGAIKKELILTSIVVKTYLPCKKHMMK